MKPFRTVLHGTCLLGGHHPAGSQLAHECPALRRQRRQDEGGATTPQGAPEVPPSGPENPATSNPLIRGGRAFKMGRPRVPAFEQRQKARERERAYRERPRVGGAA